MHLLVNTGGGDAPGLNALIRSVTLSAVRRGFKVTGIRRGYAGLLDEYPDGLIPLNRELVRGIADRGGTLLGTVNKGHPFDYESPQAGQQIRSDVSDTVLERIQAIGADGLIAAGGDGSLRILSRFMQKGLKVIAVPKTIDNDLGSTEQSFGFDSAMSFATEAIGRLHSTAEAHSRVMVVEVMGRYAGWIALMSGIAGGANVILLPEIDFDIEAACRAIQHRYATNRRFAIVVAAEGAKPRGGALFLRAEEQGKEPTLGGVGAFVAAEIARRTGYETRNLVLGHLQRGGSPTAFDRTLALRYGAAAVRFAAKGLWGHLVAYQPPRMIAVPISEALFATNSIPPEHDALTTAEDLGICVGR